MNKLLVFQSDFGMEDGAISAMEGVSFGVSSELNIRHLTHNIPAFNIFEASYRLFQTVNYWPEGTVFVSIVDPGVGSNRKSVVAKLKNGSYIVTPDNGTLTHVNEFVGIEAVREIDETKNRLKGSSESYTFHGRDVYAYTGARLAAGVIDFEGVGPELNVKDIQKVKLFGCNRIEGGVEGAVDILDGRFGSLWTSIPRSMFDECGFRYGDVLETEIYHDGKKVYSKKVKYETSFSKVDISDPIIYMNSANHMALAINQGNFSKAYGIGTGSNWTITMKK